MPGMVAPTSETTICTPHSRSWTSVQQVLKLCRSLPSNMQISDNIYLPTLPLFRFSMSCSVTCIVSRLQCFGTAPIKPSRLADKLKISQLKTWVTARPKGNQTIRSCQKLDIQRLCGPCSAVHAQALQQSQSLATASDGRAIVTQTSMMTHSLVRHALRPCIPKSVAD